MRDQRKLGGGLETARGRGGGRGGGGGGGGPTPNPGGLAQDSGVVQGCSRSCSAASSACRILSSARLALMARSRLLFMACPFSESRRAETLSSTSLHFSAKIHSFRLASCAFAFGTALRRSVNASFSLVGSFGGLWRHSQRRDWRTWYRISSRDGAVGVGTGGRDACSKREGRCSPGHTILF